MTVPFIWTLWGPCRVINSYNFNIVVSQGRERPKERERGEGTAVREQSEHSQHLSIKFTILYGHSLWHPKTIMIITSKVTDHHNRYNKNEKVRNITRIIECDTETQSEQMLWKNGTCGLMQHRVNTNLQFEKKKHNTIATIKRSTVGAPGWHSG